jgi:glutathione synthase/RimK-type ligase-like ATP-grasp enzyme
MSYTRATKTNAWFDDEFKSLQAAFAKKRVALNSPSKDGFLRRFSVSGKQVYFTADALPLNSASAKALARDKLATYQVLIEEGIAIPRGIAFFGKEFHQRKTKVEPHLLFKSMAKTGFSSFLNLFAADSKVVVKPGQGSRGYMVNVCKTLFEIELCAKNVLTVCHYGLVQEYIEGPEYRVVVLDDKAIVIYRKQDSPFEKKRNWEIRNPVRGDTGVSIPIDKAPNEVVQIALKASRALGLRYSGVDVCLPCNTPPAIILEVNSNPGFDALEKDPRFDAQKLADTIVEAVLASYSTTPHSS